MAKKIAKTKHEPDCKCPQCGTPERVRKLGKTITTNLCHVLGGLCSGCVMKEAS